MTSPVKGMSAPPLAAICASKGTNSSNIAAYLGAPLTGNIAAYLGAPLTECRNNVGFVHAPKGMGWPPIKSELKAKRGKRKAA